MAKNSENLAIVYDDVTIALGALATKTGILGTGKIDSSRLNGFRVMKCEYWISYEGKTSGEGPIMIGAASGLTLTNIESAIEGDPQSGIDPLNANTKLPVWPLEMLPEGPTVQNEIMKGSFNPRWSTPEGFNFVWWAYNCDGGALTTGTDVHIFAKFYGVWLRD